MRANREREIAAAAVRLAREPMRPLRELTRISGTSQQALLRYATTGRNGAFLDAVKDWGEWYSSVEAVRSLLRAWADKQAKKAQSTLTQATNGN